MKLTICRADEAVQKMTHPYQGKLLIASPSLDSNHLSKTVVLVIQQSDEGSFGAILNRPAPKKMFREWAKLSGQKFIAPSSLAIGGPKGGPVFALHQSEFLSEFNVAENIYLTSSVPTLHQISRERIDKFKIFMGMVGWEVGQLEDEVAKGLWFPQEFDSAIVFGDTDQLWETSLRDYGSRLWCDLLGCSNLGNNSELN